MRRRRSEGFRIMCVFSKPKGRGRKTISEGSRAHLTRASSALSARVNLGSCRASVGGVGGGVGARATPTPCRRAGRSRTSRRRRRRPSLRRSYSSPRRATRARLAARARTTRSSPSSARATAAAGTAPATSCEDRGTSRSRAAGAASSSSPAPARVELWIFQITRCARFLTNAARARCRRARGRVDAREGRRRRLARFSRESRGGESRDRACACRARVEVTTEGSGRRSEYTRAICLLICLNDENIDVCARVSAIRIQRCTAVCQNSLHS